MRDYDAAAEEKAGHDLRKAQDERDTINNVLLVQARAKCKEAGESFEKFRKQYCPDLSRSRLYTVLAIADGRKTVEQDRAEKRESVAKSRAKVSSTSAVGDTPGCPGWRHRRARRTTSPGLARRLESKSQRSPATTSTPKRPQRRARRRRQRRSRASRLTTRPHRTTSSSATSRRASTGRYYGGRVVGRRSVRLQESLRPIPPGHDRDRGSQKGPRVLHDRLRQARQASSHASGVSVEYTPTMKVREPFGLAQQRAGHAVDRVLTVTPTPAALPRPRVERLAQQQPACRLRREIQDHRHPGVHDRAKSETNPPQLPKTAGSKR